MTGTCKGPYQMCVQRQVGQGPDCSNDEGTLQYRKPRFSMNYTGLGELAALQNHTDRSTYDGDVWHKSAVHDIHMNPVSSSSLNSLDLQQD